MQSSWKELLMCTRSQTSKYLFPEGAERAHNVQWGMLSLQTHRLRHHRCAVFEVLRCRRVFQTSFRKPGIYNCTCKVVWSSGASSKNFLTITIRAFEDTTEKNSNSRILSIFRRALKINTEMQILVQFFPSKILHFESEYYSRRMMTTKF